MTAVAFDSSPTQNTYPNRYSNYQKRYVTRERFPRTGSCSEYSEGRNLEEAWLRKLVGKIKGNGEIF